MVELSNLRLIVSLLFLLLRCSQGVLICDLVVQFLLDHFLEGDVLLAIRTELISLIQAYLDGGLIALEGRVLQVVGEIAFVAVLPKGNQVVSIELLDHVCWELRHL